MGNLAYVYAREVTNMHAWLQRLIHELKFRKYGLYDSIKNPVYGFDIHTYIWISHNI